MRKYSLSRSILVMVLLWVLSFGSFFEPVRAEGASLDAGQRNAIALLNYVSVLTQSISASKNSRLYLENAYSSLINNIHPNAVSDQPTLDQMTALLDTMEDYRMVAVKRDRLQYIYEQNQARAIRQALPSPLGLLSMVLSERGISLASVIVYMAADSITSYKSDLADNELQYLQEGWNLDDEEAGVLHSSRKNSFSYLIQMVSAYGLPGDLTLTESDVDEFVKWKNSDSAVRRIQFLESNRKTYQTFGGYWLSLAESYFSTGNYTGCLEAVRSYQALNTRIFRKDYEFAGILPLVITALSNTQGGESYVPAAAEYAGMILDNTDHSDWALRYFAAQTYVDLYGKTGDTSHLRSAYGVVLDSVNYLVGEQRTLNAAYLAPVQDAPIPRGAPANEKNQIGNYNKMLREKRKAELPPIHEPLLLNCDLLFALARELEIPESERQRVDSILHPRGEPVFLVEPLDQKYWFLQDPSARSVEPEIEFGGTAMILPAAVLTENARIRVEVREADAAETELLTDWKIDRVARISEGDVSTYQAVYISEAARGHAWKPEAEISVEITPREGSDLSAYHYEYTTEGTKREWYDYLKIWEGHKNTWYDYAKVWENSVVFKRIN